MKTLNPSRTLLVYVGLPICLLSATALAFTLKTRGQQPQLPDQVNKENLLRRVEGGSEIPLRVAGNNDCPLKISQASTKVISGPEFTQLTDKNTNLVTVSTVPEIALVNTSAKTVSGFVLAVRNSASGMNRGVVQPRATIAPGDTYRLTRADFVSPETVSTVDSAGKGQQKVVQPRLSDEKYWIQFAEPSDVFVFVSLVVFQDGSEWKVAKGGEVK